MNGFLMIDEKWGNVTAFTEYDVKREIRTIRCVIRRCAKNCVTMDIAHIVNGDCMIFQVWVDYEGA